MTTLPPEFDRIARHFRPLAGPGALGLEDDAAVFAPPPGRELVIAADAMVQGVHFLASDPPDLVVSAVSVPDHVALGTSFDVTYTVTNQGGDTQALQSSWDDLVYLSFEPFLDYGADRYLGSFSHDGGLAANGSYSNTLHFSLPANLPGNSYYVIVVTDPPRSSATGSCRSA